jgi:hypothetical protein
MNHGRFGGRFIHVTAETCRDCLLYFRRAPGQSKRGFTFPMTRAVSAACVSLCVNLQSLLLSCTTCTTNSRAWCALSRKSESDSSSLAIDGKHHTVPVLYPSSTINYNLTRLACALNEVRVGFASLAAAPSSACLSRASSSHLPQIPSLHRLYRFATWAEARCKVRIMTQGKPWRFI